MATDPTKTAKRALLLSRGEWRYIGVLISGVVVLAIGGMVAGSPHAGMLFLAALPAWGFGLFVGHILGGMDGRSITD